VALEDEDGKITKEAQSGSAEVDDPEKLAMHGELKNVLRSAVDRLPETYRSVFMLREE
jgi:DNA-directed RNA polymerase specialized sigma24 family protein